MLRYLNFFNYRNFLYDLINYISSLALFLFIFMQLKKTGTRGLYSKFLLRNKDAGSRWHSVATAAEALILLLFAAALPTWTFTRPFSMLFYDFTGRTGAVLYFGCLLFLIPFFLLGAFLLGVKPLKTLDLSVPGFSLSLIYFKLACFCSGCCNGIKTDYGFFNYRTKRVEFPVQLVESAEALLIFVILMKVGKKAKTGTMFPLYLVLYSVMRFFSEFFRAQPDIVGPLKCVHLFCIAGALLGFAGFVLAEKYGERIDSAFAGLYLRIEKSLYKK